MSAKNHFVGELVPAKIKKRTTPPVKLFRQVYTVNYFTVGFVVCMPQDSVNEALHAVFTFTELHTQLSVHTEEVERV